MSAQRFSQEFQCFLLVAPFGDEALKHCTLMIDSAPQVVLLPINLLENFVETPLSAAQLHGLDPTLSDLRRKHWSKSLPPIADGFVADVDTALVQQILDVPK
jgi:hypothetical protein